MKAQFSILGRFFFRSSEDIVGVVVVRFCFRLYIGWSFQDQNTAYLPMQYCHHSTPNFNKFPAKQLNIISSQAEMSSLLQPLRLMAFKKFLFTCSSTLPVGTSMSGGLCLATSILQEGVFMFMLDFIFFAKQPWQVCQTASTAGQALLWRLATLREGVPPQATSASASTWAPPTHASRICRRANPRCVLG